QDSQVMLEYENFVPLFDNMEALADVLRRKRFGRGAIDFDFKEAKVLVDEEGKASHVVIVERSVGEKLIEEFMLCSNETIAEHFHWMDVPFVHRIHEKPDEAKMNTFFEFLGGLGLGMKGKASDVNPLELQKVLNKVKGEQEVLV